jgi:integrase
MPSLHLIRTNIDKIQPTGTETSYQDTHVPGLVLRVSARGVKTFIVRRRVNGRDERVTIGRYPIFTPEMARAKALALLGQMATGVNPKEVARRQKQAGTIASLFACWLANAKARKKRSTEHDEGRFNQHLKVFGERSPDSISKSEVRAWHLGIGERSGPTAANRAAELLRRLYLFGAKHEGLTCPIPTDDLEKFPEVERDRRLSSEELPRFVQALKDEPNQDMADLFRLLLLTGIRLSPVCEMRWADLDLPARRWRIPLTKNGKPHTVVLVEAAAVILERRRQAETCEWVFPGKPQGKGKEVKPIAEPKSAWKRVCRRAGIADLRIHDLRHTFASLLTDDGASTKQVGQAVGHRDQRSTNRYMHASTEALRPVIESALAPLSDLLAEHSTETNGSAKG